MVKISARDRQAQQLQVQEQLILMIDQVLEVSHEQRHQRFPFGNEHRRNQATQVVVGAESKPAIDVGGVFTNAVKRLLRRAGVIDLA